jgi:hypothetical protein
MTTHLTTPARRLRSRRNLLVVFAILALAGIAAGGFGLWYILDRDSQSGSGGTDHPGRTPPFPPRPRSTVPGR